MTHQRADTPRKAISGKDHPVICYPGLIRRRGPPRYLHDRRLTTREKMVETCLFWLVLKRATNWNHLLLMLQVEWGDSIRQR